MGKYIKTITSHIRQCSLGVVRWNILCKVLSTIFSIEKSRIFSCISPREPNKWGIWDDMYGTSKYVPYLDIDECQAKN